MQLFGTSSRVGDYRCRGTTSEKSCLRVPRIFRLSEYSRLEIASLVIAGLIVSGAVRMLFFYMTAAKQSVYAYWVWDDLIIQAINVVPLALVGLAHV